MAAPPPDPLPRPAFARFLWERDIDLARAAEAIDCSAEHVRRICLPFSDPKRKVPAPDLMARIVRWTNGQILPADFYEPHLSMGGLAMAEAAP